MNLFTKRETDLQILKTNLWLPKGNCVLGERGESGARDEHTHTTMYTMYKTGNQQGPIL